MIRKWGYIILLASIASAAPSDESKDKAATSASINLPEIPTLFGNLRRTLASRPFSQGLSTSLGFSRETAPQESYGPNCLSLLRALRVQRTLQRSLTMTIAAGGNVSSPTMKFDTIELAEHDGYSTERHSVVTEDGYILGVHRIFNSSVCQDNPSARPVVILQHGICIDSRAFIVMRQAKSIAYALADAGYDVWLNNARGNTYSRKHETLTPDMKEFWDFSMTEYGVYDIPAVIKYSLEVTGQSKAHFIGHSMGTQVFFIMADKRPEVLSQVKTYTALAPLLTFKDAPSALVQTLMKTYAAVAAAFESVGQYAFLTRDQKLAGIPLTTRDSWILKIAGPPVIYALAGGNPCLDNSIVPDLLGHLPAGASVRVFRQYGQNYNTGFRDYDYGKEENLARYNSEEPPLFDLSKSNVPTQVYYGYNDRLANHKSAVNICSELPNVFRCEGLNDPYFGHGDFMWSTSAPSVLYDRMIEGLRLYDEQQCQKSS